MEIPKQLQEEALGKINAIGIHDDWWLITFDVKFVIDIQETHSISLFVQFRNKAYPRYIESFHNEASIFSVALKATVEEIQERLLGIEIKDNNDNN